ncbi:MAG: hypothetical protein JRI23_36555 [Deltaproteobacteria bacterium]|nr:hypothetical protein [Deltaproteobacteria bacterium]MBW2537868.1 hypothetical protein [Deltaproteobacteria bacterium]
MDVERALHVVELVHWVALGVMALVYTTRLLWLFRFPGARDRQLPGEHGTTGLGPAIYSLGNVAMPWVMESTRKNMGFWLSFVVFHLGVVVGITLAFVSSLYRPFVEMPMVGDVFMVVLGAAFLVGLVRIVRRLKTPYLRLISSPDDYFSLFMLTGWFLSGALAQAHIAGHLPSKWFMVAFLAATSFFLLYVPFSKISHYLYYPFTRFWIGRTLGHRGSMPAARG